MKTINTYYELNRVNENALFIDSKENPVDSLETTRQFFLRDDNLKWKWIILSLHHALYLFCIANLQGTSHTEVLSSSQEEDMNDYFQDKTGKWKKSRKDFRNEGFYTITWTEIEDEPTIKEKSNKRKFDKLISFKSAIARVQDGELYMNRYIHSKPIVLSDIEWKSIEKLNEYRNTFTHYIPISYIMSIDELKEICLNIVLVIEFLIFETGQIIFYDKSQVDRSKTAISELKKILK